jgi:enolase
MPVPAFDVINEGGHAENRLSCQEFMILPTGATSFKDVYHTLKSVVKEECGQDLCNVDDAFEQQ